MRGDGDMDRVERESAPVRHGLAVVAAREGEGSEVRDQQRRAPPRARRVFETGRRDRAQGVAGEKGRGQYRALEGSNVGVEEEEEVTSARSSECIGKAVRIFRRTGPVCAR